MAEATGLTNLHVLGDLTVDGTVAATGLTPTVGGIDTANIADNAVTTAKINALAVTAAKLAADAVTTAKILDANVTPAKLSAPNAEETISFFVAGGQSTGTLKAAALVGVAGTIVDVRARLPTAPVGSAFIVDVNKNGTTIFTTQGNRPTVADGANASSTTAPDVTSLAAGDYLSVDVDQVGSGTAGSDLLVSVTIKRTIVS